MVRTIIASRTGAFERLLATADLTGARHAAVPRMIVSTAGRFDEAHSVDRTEQLSSDATSGPSEHFVHMPNGSQAAPFVQQMSANYAE